MLVLSRQRDEVIKIGDEIEITIVDIRGDKVRLGITAPSKIAVHRKEVYQAITKENAEAAAAAGQGLPQIGTGVPVSAGPMRLVKPPTKGASRLAVKAEPVSTGISMASPSPTTAPGNQPGSERAAGSKRVGFGTRVAENTWTAKSA
jgi:carbon storage regulator